MPGVNQAHEHIAAQENQKPHEDPNAERTESGEYIVLSDKKEGSAGTNQKSGEQSASHAAEGKSAEPAEGEENGVPSSK